MKLYTAAILIHIFAALTPLLSFGITKTNGKIQAITWPESIEGRYLEPLELDEREKRFAEDFPGSIARFTDGEREIIVRAVHRPSRQLHPSGDCLKGVGYETTPLPIKIDFEGNAWGCLNAQKDERQLYVCERIYDNAGNSWSDVSSWFWAATLGRTTGPWLAVTTASET